MSFTVINGKILTGMIADEDFSFAGGPSRA
jgi:hypothetical protein